MYNRTSFSRSLLNKIINGINGTIIKLKGGDADTKLE